MTRTRVLGQFRHCKAICGLEGIGRVARANCTAYVSIYLASTDDATSRHIDADIASERQQTLPDEHVAQTVDTLPDVAAELFVAGNRFDLAAFH